MPIYDYVCPKCGAEEEKYSSIADRKNQFCVCGIQMGMRVNKPSLHFKTGLHSTNEVPFDDFDIDAVDIHAKEKENHGNKE